MASVNARDLVTQEDVSSLLLESDAESVLTDKVFDQNGSRTEQGVEFIEMASFKVKDYVNRELVVHELNPLLAGQDWERVNRTPNEDYPYRLKFHRVAEWPVLSVTEDVKIHGDRKIFAKDETFSTIEYFAGYRRSDQSSLSVFDSNIQNEFGSASDIPVLPSIIQDVTARVAIHRALRSLKGLIGIKRIEQKFGDFSGTSEVEDAKETYEYRQLKRLNPYRFLT